MPHNHLIGLLYLLSYPSVGAAVVFPAPSFDASAVLLAFEEDRCTNFIGVPTMLHALLDRMQGGKHSFRLRQADIAGAAVSAHHMRQVTHELGAEKVGTSFGMTEGTPIRAAPVSDPEELIRGDIVLCGKPLSGARVRICEHGTERVLPRGEYGELHQSGDQLIDHYIGIDESKDFYFDDSGRKWFRSGDQAVMMEDDAVSIVGRYKDMIIRGGENISPAVIERVLNGLPGVNAQVIGCMDEIAGEVPVAVYQCSQAVSLDSMQDLILKHLGSTYVPSDFFSLHELGIEDFPKTVSGKVQKPELARIVREHLKTREQPVVNGYHEPLREHILRIWASLIGISAENLDIRSSVSDFADSITIMRFRDKIRKETGRQISLEDMIANDSISAQTEFLQKQNVGQDKSTPSIVLGRSGPPKAQDMIHTGGDEALAKETRALVEGIIEPHGFTWNEDVEDVMPAYDFIQTLYTLQRPTSHSRRHTLITKSHDVETLHAALRATVTKHSVMRSFFIRQNIGTQDEQAFYVSMRPTDRWFSKAITENGKISTIADLKRFAADDPALDHSFPGPLYRAMIFHVEETGTAGFAHNGNHVTFDAMAVRLYVEDLEKALSSQNAVLQDHIPFKFWADTYYSLRDSLTAQRAVKFQVQRLAALSKHCKALFPPQRAPKWFLGPHRDWKPTEEDIKKGYENLNRAWLSQPSSYETNGITWRGELPSLKKLRDAVPELSAPVTAKAAFAMMLAHYTNHTHALFALVEAARGSLPFVPDHISSQLDHIACADVSGPCFEILTDLVEVDRNETLTNFLKRLQNEQLHITKNAHAPVRKVVEALGTNAEGTGSGDVYLEAMRRVQFNWAPGAGNTGDGPEPNIRPLLGNSLTDIGLAILAGAGGANGTTCTLNIRWDDANVTREEAEGMIGDMSKIWTWITEGGPWDRPVGGFTEYL